MVESGRVLGKGRICASTKTVWVSTEKWQKQCKYRKMVESVRVPETGRIGQSTEKLFGPVPEELEYL